VKNVWESRRLVVYRNWVRGCESDCGENSNEPMYSLKEEEKNE
jgi:hypothetical protein